MNDFFSKFVDKVKENVPKKLLERMTLCWTDLLKCTLKNTRQNLIDFHEKIVQLVSAIKEGIDSGDITGVTQVLENNQIPSNLVNLGFADIPHGLVNEVTYFFTEISKGQSSILLTQPFVITPLNKFLESAQPSDQNGFNCLIEVLIAHITSKPDDIQYFITSEASAPLIHQFTQMIVVNYQVMGDSLIQIMNSARSNTNLLAFLTTYSPLIATCIEFIRDCIESRSVDSSKQRFLMSIDASLTISPDEYKKSFMNSFIDSILRSFVYEEKDQQYAISSCIYILASFNAREIVGAVIEHMSKQLPEMISKGDSGVKFLSLRAAEIMLEHSKPQFQQAPDNYKVSLDFMGLLNAEWFVKSDINKQLLEARARVALALSKSQTIQNNALQFDAQPIADACFEVLKTFSTNELNVNLALTSYLTTLSSVWGQNITYFTLSSECKNGLFSAVKNICSYYTGRLGSRPGLSPLISKAYDMLKEGAASEDEEEEYFMSLALLLEFIKELHSTAQSKNMLNQSEAIVPI